jgi:hypothetical protein
MSGKNPITERLERLYDQYIDFVDDDDARLLRWVITSDEARMIETFVAVENSEGGELPDLFVRLVVPFDQPRLFALELRGALLEQYHDARTKLGLPDWTPPPASGTDDAIPSLVQTCKSLLEHAREDPRLAIEHLVLVLLPPSVSDAAEWSVWLRRAAHAIDTPEIRLVVLDLQQTAVLQPLAEAEPTVVHTEVAALDMPGAYLEVSARAGGLDKPHGAFRHGYVQLVNAIAAGDLDGAKTRAAAAIRIASAQGWWHLVVAVHFCLGSGFLSRAQPVEAIRWFRMADETAAAAESRNDFGNAGPPPADDDAPEAADTARSLRVKSRLGMAAAAYSAGAWDQAAKLYVDTAPMAEAIGDLRTVLDCQRMAGHCREKAGAYEPAWNHGIEAIGTGGRMDEETRRTSTLAFAGEALLHLAKRSRFQPYRASIEREMQRLLGPDWRPKRGAEAGR